MDTVVSSINENDLCCNDLTKLPYLCESVVLKCITLRYQQGIFYTWAGPTLIAVNPCRPSEHLYTFAKIKYHQNLVKHGCDYPEPHVYNVAGLAHHRLSSELGLINQAILVSGESGAGKTESARFMLNYLTFVEDKVSIAMKSPSHNLSRDKSPEDIQHRIVASNPILEAFGNASTLKNHNSSRFGKLICLQYGCGQLRGAELETYLLEKTRVTHQPSNERNFHIFYQVLAGISEGLLKFEVEFNCIFRIAADLYKKNDISCLNETLKAFKILGFNDLHLQNIFKCILGLMFLGNITFSQKKGVEECWTINNSVGHQNLMKASKLLEININELSSILTSRTICIGDKQKTVYVKACNRQSECEERRDAFMQHLYNALFSHIVLFINSQTNERESLWQNFMGILDVYGFETFEDNSLEQLCINYANERLQQAFTKRYLSVEQKVLKEEGFLDFDIPYNDNLLCLSALDSKLSVFAFLNEACQLKRDVDENETCSRICKALAPSGVVTTPTSPLKSGFRINHYAGPVTYTSSGMLFKNKDEVPNELQSLLLSSQSAFISSLVTFTEVQIQPSTTPRKTSRKITTLSKFKISLDSLMKKLELCDLHYVRCIKPNSLGMPGNTDDYYVLNQLHACGIIDTVRICQAGFPVRMTYNDFIYRYGCSISVGNLTEEAHIIVSKVFCDDVLAISQLVRFGNYRIFLSESALHSLEDFREQQRHRAATSIQKYVRKFLSQKNYIRLVRALHKIQAWAKFVLQRKRYHKMKVATIIIQKYVRRYIAVCRYHRILWAAVTLQKNARLWLNKKKNALPAACSRSVSMMSGLSTLEGLSCATSLSMASLGQSVTDGSLSDWTSIEYTPLWLRRRLLETEESGIETDTESLSGDVSSPKIKEPRSPHYRYKRSKRRKAALPTTTAEESEDCNNLLAKRNRSVSCRLSPLINSKTETLKTNLVFKEERACYILRNYRMSENLQLTFKWQSLSLFFWNGVLSYRRMPSVNIKFHTRRTCLPFSHILPYCERPHGLMDAL